MNVRRSRRWVRRRAAVGSAGGGAEHGSESRGDHDDGGFDFLNAYMFRGIPQDDDAA